MAAHRSTGTMTPPEQYRSYRFDHLGLVAGMFDELGLRELLDNVIVQDASKRHISVGQAVKAMVLNGLGFTNKALYLTPHFFQDKPLERLLGPGVEAAHLNDDVLGRSLDALYGYGISQLYGQLAAQAVHRLGISARVGHLDSTSFHTDGVYNSEQGASEGVIHITRGYSRDHRPELNQVVLQLVVSNQGGIPLWLAACNGNSSDQMDFRQTVNAHIEQLKEAVGMEYLVADSALYSAKSLQQINDVWWITRVPETLTLAKEVLRATAAELSHDDEAEMSTRSLCVEYAGVRQRWVVVYSAQARARALKSVQKQCLKKTNANLKALQALSRQSFACESDAQQALQAFTNTLTLTTVTEARIVKTAHYSGKGRPRANQAVDHYSYTIEAVLASCPERYTERLEQKSCFILATNQLDTQALTDEQLVATYKDQQQVERGFRFLKDPRFLAHTLYLKSPKRVMALMMIMTLSLLIYAALEYRIRQLLAQHQQTVPNQLGEAVQNPTARWVFQFFAGIHVLVIDQLQQRVLNLKHYQRVLIDLLGECYQRLYDDSG